MHAWMSHARMHVCTEEDISSGTKRTRHVIKTAKEAAAAAVKSNSLPSLVHTTFDFAQHIFVPFYHSRHVGPLYYKVYQ